VKFVFLTRTDWTEPPRIRRQLSDLLLSHGHSVIFYQKPKFLVSRAPILISEKLTLVKTAYLIHHQLRLNRFLRNLNAIYEKLMFKYFGQKVDGNVVVINFNYDYVFIRSLFPKNKIITIINDDFVAQAKFKNGNHVVESQKITCAKSNVVLAVSNSLVSSLCSDKTTNLFLPWSIENYRKPKKRNLFQKSILIWGYIDSRIDDCFLSEIIETHREYEFLIVGPICKNFLPLIRKIQYKSPNLKILGVKKLSELPLESIVCSLVPYKLASPFGNSVTMLNKGFQLLSKGLPLIIRGMPNFLKSECIFDVVDKNSFSSTLEYIDNNFNQLQTAVSQFVEQNSAEKRYQEFMNYVEE
jgi:hypothetical protein